MHSSKQYPVLLPRHSALMALEGWHKPLCVPPPKYAEWFKKHAESGTKLGLTKWLHRHSDLKQQDLVKIGEQLAATPDFKFSCRLNDIRRMGVSTHFRSCYRPGGQAHLQVVNYLADPNIAIAYIPDKTGDFKWRCAFVLCKNNNDFCLLSLRVYGNGPTEGIFRKINSWMPVYVGHPPSVCVPLRRYGSWLLAASRSSSPVSCEAKCAFNPKTKFTTYEGTRFQ